ncbi:MAG: hypothetical protein Tsb0015_12880 [Simkaniaceae bacterium]
MKKKYFVSVLFSFLIFLLLFIAVLPSILSSNWGTQKLTAFIEKKTKDSVKVQDLSLQWFGPQIVTGLHYAAKDNSKNIDIPQIFIDSSLFSIIFHKAHLDKTKVLSPKVVISLPDQKKIREEITSPAKTTALPFLPIFITGKLQINDGQIMVRQQEAYSLLKDIDIDLEIFRSQIQKIKVQGKSDENGTFQIQGEFNFPRFYIDGGLHKFPLTFVENVLWAFNIPFYEALTESLGDFLNGKFEISREKSKAYAYISFHSSLSQGVVKLKFADGKIILENEANIAFALSSDLLQMIKEKYFPCFFIKPAQNTQPQISCHIQKFQAEYADFQIFLKNLQLQAVAKVQGLSIDLINPGEEILLKSLNCSLNTEDFDLGLDWNITGNWQQDSKLGTLSSSGNYAKGAKFAWEQAKLAADWEIKNFPAIIFTYLYQEQKWPAFFGKFINSNGSIHKNVKEPSTASFSIENEILHWKNIQLQYDRRQISLRGPASLTYHLQPDTLAAAFPEILMQDPAEVSIYLSSLSFFAEKNWKKNFRLSGSLKVPAITFNRLDEIQQVRCKQLQAEIKENSDMAITAAIRFLDENSFLHTLVPDWMEASLSFLHNFHHIDLKAKNPQIFIEGGFQWNHNRLSTKDPLQIQYTLTPDTYKHFGLLSSLIEPVQISFQAESMLALFTKSYIKDSVLTAHARAENLQIKSQQTEEIFSMANVQLSLNKKAGQNPEISYSGKIIDALQKIGEIQGRIELSNTYLEDFSNYPINSGSIEIHNVATSFTSSVIKELPDLSPLIGKNFSLHVQYKKNLHSSDMSASLNAPLISASGNLLLKEKALQLEGPAKIQWSLTPEGYTLLDKILTGQKKNPFSLASPSQIKGNIKSLYIPLEDANLSSLITKSFFEIQWKINKFSLAEKKSSKIAELSELKFTSNRKRPSDSWIFQLTGKISEGNSQENGSLSIQSKLHPKEIHFTGEIHHFPTIFIDAMTRFSGYDKNPFHAFFGNSLDANFKIAASQNTGPVYIRLYSNNASAELDGRLQNGILLLNRPFLSSVKMTKELSNLLLGNFQITALSSKDPVQLVIDSTNFAIPVKNYDLKRARIPFFTLKLGQITCENKGSLRSLAKLFSIKKTRLPLWFADMDMRLKEGKLKIQRTEVLFNNEYQIAFWGDVNLIKKKVDLILGLTSSALKGAFGLKKMSPDYVLTVPISGPFANIKIDTSEATRKIAILIAKEKGIAPSKGLWGEAFGVIETFADDQSKVPPPKKPFPWEERFEERKDPGPSKMKSKKKKESLKKYLKNLKK